MPQGFLSKGVPLTKKTQLTGVFADLPNKLTLLRIAVVPLLIVLFPWDYQGLRVACGIIFAFGAITDFFDGYLARKFSAETRLGALLDPISDKILITSALILLTGANIIPAWMAVVLICRDIAISGLRLAASEQQFSIEVNSLGKSKTAVQDVAIGLLLSTLPSLYVYGMILLWIALGLSLYSAYQYWREFWNISDKAEKIKNDPTLERGTILPNPDKLN